MSIQTCKTFGAQIKQNKFAWNAKIHVIYLLILINNYNL